MKSFVKARETEIGVKIKWREDDEHKYEDIDFQNYFYISKDDFAKEHVHNAIKRFSKKATLFTTSQKVEYVKIYFTNNFLRKDLKWKLENLGIKHYEADIMANKRWLIDANPELDFTGLKVIYIDIETDDRKPMDKELNGTVIPGDKQIMSIALADDDGNEWYFRNEDVDDKMCISEKKLLKDSFEIIDKFDIITAWSSKRFDFPYMQQRQESVGMKWSFNWHMINKFDDMEKYKKGIWGNKMSFALNAVASDELSDGKVDFSDEIQGGKGRFYRLWKEKPELSKTYNTKDTTLMRDIEKKLRLYDIHRTIATIAGCPIEETMHNSHVCDYMMLRIYKRKNIVAPSIPTWKEKKMLEYIKVSGGYTFAFEKGFYEFLDVFDYKSEYPLIMMTYNISPEVFIKAEDVDWEEVITFMTQEELDFMRFAQQAANSSVKMGEYKAGESNKKIKKYMQENEIDYSLESLMWKFVDKYVGHKYVKYAKENDLIMTPADYNHDTNGWHFHPHRFFKRNEDGALKEISTFVLTERDKVKYKLWKGMEKDPHFGQTPKGKRLDAYQGSVKTVGNSLFGFTGFKASRFFNFHICDTITTCARFQMKKSIIFSRRKNYLVTNGDTDSIFIKWQEGVVGDIHDMNVAFYEYYDELFKPYNTNLSQEVSKPLNGIQMKENKALDKEIEQLDKNKGVPLTLTYTANLRLIDELKDKKHIMKKEIKPFYCIFEHEKTYTAIIIVAKKRYYFLTDYGDVATQGGAFKKRDTNPLAAELQKELVTDILKKQFVIDDWQKKLTMWKNACFNFTLEEKYLTFTKGYTNHWSTFGGPMLDKSTGHQKETADGRLRFKPIPAHIKLIKRLDEAGELKIEPGDALQYIVGKPLLTGVRILREKAARKRCGDDKIDKLQKFIQSTFDDNGVCAESDFINHQHTADALNVQIKYDYETTQRAITLEEYRAGAEYNTARYWGSIISPTLEILNVTHKEEIKTKLLDCWNYTEVQLKKIIKEIETEAENEDEEDKEVAEKFK